MPGLEESRPSEKGLDNRNGNEQEQSPAQGVQSPVPIPDKEIAIPDKEIAIPDKDSTSSDPVKAVLDMLYGNVARENPDTPQLLRPDVNTTTMTLFSLFGGFLGLDHMYARSPITGVLKLITGGGFGMWWAWDAIQLLFERERVERYGLTGFLNGGGFLGKGVGQGMMTSLQSAYKSEVPYSLWMFGMFLSFLGFDALVAKDIGLFLRKLLEFAVFAVCALSLLNFSSTGIFTLFFSFIICTLLGSAIVMEYISVMSVVLRGTLMSEGINYTPKEKKHYNSALNKMMDLLPERWFNLEQKQQVKENLAYRGIPVERIQKLLTIFHISEIPPPSGEPEDDPAKMTTVISFFIYMISPILIIGQMIWDLCYAIFKSIEYLINPTAAARDAAIEIAKKTAEALAKAAAAKLEEKGFGGAAALVGAAGAVAGAAAGGKKGLAGLTGGKKGLAGGVPGLAGLAGGKKGLAGLAGGVPGLAGLAGGKKGLAGLAGGVPSLSAAAGGVPSLAGLAGGVPSLSAAAGGVPGLAAAAGGVPGLAAAAGGVPSLAGLAGGVPSLAGLAGGVPGLAAGVPSLSAAAAGVPSLAGLAGGVPGLAAGVPGLASLAGGVPGLSAAAAGVPSLSAAAAGVPGLATAAAAAKQQPSSRMTFAPTRTKFAPTQVGGAFAEPLSTEAQIFGAVTVALISGGVIKGLVDYLIAE